MSLTGLNIKVVKWSLINIQMTFLKFMDCWFEWNGRAWFWLLMGVITRQWVLLMRIIMTRPSPSPCTGRWVFCRKLSLARILITLAITRMTRLFSGRGPGAGASGTGAGLPGGGHCPLPHLLQVCTTSLTSLSSEFYTFQISRSSGGDSADAGGSAVWLNSGEVRQRGELGPGRREEEGGGDHGADAGGDGAWWHHEQGNELRRQSHL